MEIDVLRDRRTPVLRPRQGGVVLRREAGCRTAARRDSGLDEEEPELVVAHGQSDDVLVFVGDKSGLSKDRVRRIKLDYRVHYEHGVYVGDFNGDGKLDLAVFGYTNTGVGARGPLAVYIWLQ